jgi:hypothetical protein
MLLMGILHYFLLLGLSFSTPIDEMHAGTWLSDFDSGSALCARALDSILIRGQ